MNSVLQRLILCVAVASLPLTLLHAEVIELEGTVKAVDAEDRSITIERKTAKGTKALELEVAKKAGNLASVKVGDTISFGYDPDLEIVTKIGGGGAKEEVAEKLPQLVRLQVAVTSTGDVAVTTAPSEAVRQKAAGSGISRTKQADGTWDCTYEFSSPQVLEAFDFLKNASFDSKTSALRLSGKGERDLASISMRGRLTTPFSFECEGYPRGQNGSFGVNMMGGDADRVMHITVQVKEIDRDDKIEVAVFLREMNMATQQWSDKSNTLLMEPVRRDQKVEKRVRLPVPNQERKYAFNLFVVSADASLQSMRYRGQCSPVFGMQLQPQGDTVFVRQVQPNTVAAQAGVKDGDVVSAINGKKPSSVQEAMEFLALNSFGETCTLSVERGAEKKDIRLKASWDQPGSGSISESKKGGLSDRLKGTKWINTNNVTFEWTNDGRLLHRGNERQWKPSGDNRVEVVFGKDHVDVIVFDESLKTFKQLIKGGPSSMNGRRVDQ